jgi:hypothetical protein
MASRRTVPRPIRARLVDTRLWYARSEPGFLGNPRTLTGLWSGAPSKVGARQG